MILCIAEKPSMARDIAAVLGATARREGYLEGGGYCVSWTLGHLCELKAPEEYHTEWKRWSLGALPMVPERFGIRLKDDEGVRRQFAVIEKLCQRAESIVNCGDAEQEGELIQRWVMQKAGVKCPVKRLWISSLTSEAIREGFAHLRPAEDYDHLYEAGLCRAIGDWLLGMNATRLYTLKYGQNDYGQGRHQPLSIGRVQTPTLSLIVARQHEIENFRPEPYWVLATLYRDTLFSAVMEEPGADGASRTGDMPDGGAKHPARRGFATEQEGLAAMERIKDAPFEVTGVQKKNGTDGPPRPFDLTSLQVECNRRFGFSAEQTLALAQSLYEKKYTTYPRVDNTYLTDDVYRQCKATLEGLSPLYGELLTPLRGRPLRKNKKVFDGSKVTDHHAIIPTGVPPQALSDMEKRVYDLVARRFIGIFYDDCRFSTTTVTGQAAGVPFKVQGKEILEPGWRAVSASGAGTPPDAATSTLPVAGRAPDGGEGVEERMLPTFVKGETGPHTPSLSQKTTTPPKPYTEATLLRAMETAGRLVDDEQLREALKKNGIGRPSTRAAIIETLFRRQYIRRQRKNLLATPTGVELIGLIKEDLLKSAELTGQWEKKLADIRLGAYAPGQFISELKEMVSEIVLQVLRDNSQRRVALGSGEGEPALGPKLSAARERDKAAAAGAQASQKERKRIVRAGSRCPKCGEGKVIKGNTAYGCSRWREGCDWRKPFKK